MVNQKKKKKLSDNIMHMLVFIFLFYILLDVSVPSERSWSVNWTEVCSFHSSIQGPQNLAIY